VKPIIDFIARNKTFVIITAAGVAVLAAIAVVPIVSGAMTPAKNTQPISGSDGPRVISSAAPTAAPTPTVSAPDPQASGSANGSVGASPTPVPSNGPYKNDGEISWKKLQAYLPAGDPKPLDKEGNPIVWQDTVMMDPTPVVNEFAKQEPNLAGGKDAWLARLRPVIGDDMYAGLQDADFTRIPSMTVESVKIWKDPEILLSGFYRFDVYYTGCGLAMQGTVEAQPEGSWLVNTASGNPDSSPVTRGAGCG
jgi:hypothetical protein